MKKKIKLSDLFQGCRSKLLEVGWCPNGWVDQNGRMCIMKAMLHSAPEDSNDERTKCYSILENLAGDPGSNIGLWNDMPGRTFQEVLDLLDQSASLSMSEENK